MAVPLGNPKKNGKSAINIGRYRDGTSPVIRVKLEARAGIEPANKGFADLSTPNKNITLHAHSGPTRGPAPVEIFRHPNFVTHSRIVGHHLRDFGERQ